MHPEQTHYRHETRAALQAGGQQHSAAQLAHRVGDDSCSPDHAAHKHLASHSNKSKVRGLFSSQTKEITLASCSATRSQALKIIRDEKGQSLLQGDSWKKKMRFPQVPAHESSETEIKPSSSQLMTWSNATVWSGSSC